MFRTYHGVTLLCQRKKSAALWSRMPNEQASTSLAGEIRVGTASWSEPEFVKAGWYPKGLPAGQRLSYYAQHFDYVELNSSFYAIPAAGLCAKWVRETPEGFLFDVKCHRLLSRHATKPDALPKDLQDQVEVTDRGNVVLMRPGKSVIRSNLSA